MHFWLLLTCCPTNALVAPTAKLLEPLADACSSGPGVTLKVHVKVKGEDGSAQMDTMLDAMRAVDEPRVGLLSKDQHLGAFVALWERKLQDSGLATTDVTAGGSQVKLVVDRGAAVLLVVI